MAKRYIRCRDTLTDIETDILSSDRRIGERFKPVNRGRWPDSFIPRPDKKVIRFKTRKQPEE